MCDKILLVVRHNDQTDQIFKTIIAPFLAAFLHTFQRWQRLFHLYIHGSIGWCSILHVRLCIKSWVTSTTWFGDWVDLCVLKVWWGGWYWERVTAKETVNIFQISQRLTISAKLYSLFLFLALFQGNNFIYENNHISKDWSKVTLWEITNLFIMVTATTHTSSMNCHVFTGQ